MTPGVSSLPVAPGLLERFRDAAGQIQWRATGGRRPLRVAHLFQEEARVELVEESEGCRCVVEAGPVGALVLLIEAERRGLPAALVAQDAGRDRRFPTGTIVAVWGKATVPKGDGTPRFSDLVDLARYALP